MSEPKVLLLSDLEQWLFDLVRRFESSARSKTTDLEMSRYALAVIQDRIRDKKYQEEAKTK